MVNKLVKRSFKIADTGSVLALRRLNLWKSNGWVAILHCAEKCEKSRLHLTFFLLVWSCFCLDGFFHFILFHLILFTGKEQAKVLDMPLRQYMHRSDCAVVLCYCVTSHGQQAC